ncbi:MAG: translation initiation factor [Bdellovibrionales bacterium]|nr:translation initiation factor [Bdellovibrionales bacterium]
MTESNSRLVWSNDPKDQSDIEHKSKPGKKVNTSEASAGVQIPNNWTAVFRIEKGGRGGKTVTVIDQLPKHETFLNDLCKELKTRCGSGGTFSIGDKGGLIEIQGDKRVAIKTIFDKKGFKYKGM